MTVLAQPLHLPCRAMLSNRIAKSAMTEGLATRDMHSNVRLENLYQIGRAHV